MTPDFPPFRPVTPLLGQAALNTVRIRDLLQYAAELATSQRAALNYIGANRPHYRRTMNDLKRAKPKAARGVGIWLAGLALAIPTGGKSLAVKPLLGFVVGAYGGYDAYDNWKDVRALSRKADIERLQMHAASHYVDGCQRARFDVQEVIRRRRALGLP